MPLAIDIAACRLVFEQALSAQALLERIQSQDNLDLLNFCERSVGKAIEASFSLLPANEQQFLKALTVFDGHDFNLDAAARSASVSSSEEANYILGQLFSLGFVRLGKSQNSYRLIPTIQTFLLTKANHE